MKMYYRITSSSPLSNFESTTRFKPILHSTGYHFFAHNFYLPALLFGSQTELCFIPSGYPLLFPIVKFFSEDRYHVILTFQSIQGSFLQRKMQIQRERVKLLQQRMHKKNDNQKLPRKFQAAAYVLYHRQSSLWNSVLLEKARN